MAFCTRCGTELPEDARFCPACGTARTAAAPAAPAAPPEPQPDVSLRKPEGARPAAGPLPPLRPERGGGGLILGAMIVAALVIIAFFLWSQRDGARPIAGNAGEAATGRADGGAAPAPAPDAAEEAPTGDAIRTTVASLDSAFVANPAGARRRYAGAVTVDGTVVSLTTGASPSLSLEGRTRFNHVIANLTDAAPFARVAAGERVTLDCRSVTALAGTTILQGCTAA